MSLPLGEVNPENPVVCLDMTVGGQSVGSLTIELKADYVPLTAQNFLELVEGKPGYGYAGSPIHRVLKGFMAQGGDIVNGDGSGNRSASGEEYFPDENFSLQHAGPGCLSMSNTGRRHTNASQFFITFDKAPHLDKKHVVFGQIIDGIDAFQAVQYAQCRTLHGSPTERIEIASCSVVNYGPFAPPAKVYIVEGTAEAAAADLDFDLVMDKDLAVNLYPTARLEAARAAEHTSLCAQYATPEIWEQYKDKVSSGPARWTLARAINTGVMYPSSFVGCHAGDSASYDDFKVRKNSDRKRALHNPPRGAPSTSRPSLEPRCV